jgi:hypothetical protein
VPSCSRPSDRRTTRQTSLQAEKKLRPETAWMHGSTRRAGYPMVSRRCRRWLRWMLTPEDLGGSHRLRHRAGVGGGLPPHPAGDPSLARRGARAVRVTARLGLTSTAAMGPPWPRRRWPDSPIPPFASLARAASSGRCWTRSLRSPDCGRGHRTGPGGPGARTTSQWDANATAQSAAPPQDSRRRRMG